MRRIKNFYIYNFIFLIYIYFLYSFTFFCSNVEAATVEKVKNFSFTNNVQTFTAPVAGYYRLETWGAGGSSSGYGAYATGVTYLNKGDILYVVVGGQGTIGKVGYSTTSGGYNGGGNATVASKNSQFGYGGHGATHIAKVSGTLSSLSSNPNAVLIVAGGGGGGDTGGNAGGIKGNDGSDASGYYGYQGLGGTQSAGGITYWSSAKKSARYSSFGQGGQTSGIVECCGQNGGGGGYFGGGMSSRGHGGAGGGSSFINSSSLISYGDITKSMYGYSVIESTVAGTYTVSTNKLSDSPISYYAKKGNGDARISLVANDDGRLETLKFSKGSLIPAFNSNTYSYQIAFDSEDSFVDIESTPVFAETTIQGVGHIGIPKGSDKIYVTGTSEAGTVVTYTINTTRPASSYKYLADIKTDGVSIPNFTPENLKYEINVPYTQESIDLTVEKGRFGQDVYLPTNTNLKTGANKFIITVVAEDGNSTVEYEVTVNREHSSKLKSLKFKNYDLEPEFNPETLSYTLKIMANTMSVSLDATAYDEEATIKMEGFGYIKSTQVGRIIVTEPNCKPTVYEITLEKQSADIVLTYDFPYTGDIQTFTAPANGYYRLETWGSQGGANGGYGAYSTGVVFLKEGTKIYITVGGQGTLTAGGYNGGGTPGYASQYGYGGGGATHISTIPDTLANLSSNRDTILIVAAGGGGGGSNTNQNLNGHGGGYIGNNGYDTYTRSYGGYNGSGASLSNGGYCPTGNNSNCGRGTFGKGGNFCNMGYGGPGGGGGYFGGGGGNRGHGAGGGGSSYIGSDALISYDTVTKSTYCFGCAANTNANNKTISTNNASTNPTRNYAKKGSGYARISTLRFPSENNYLSSLTITATDFQSEETNIKTYSPKFDIEEDEYSVTLQENETSITFLAKAEDKAAEIDGLGTFDVPAGTTDFYLKVKAESGAIRTITIHVTRPASTNAQPINIEVNGMVASLCAANPDFCVVKPTPFDASNKNYEIIVPSKIKQVWFDVTASHPFQKIEGDGKVNLNSGENNFTIKVTSEDGNTTEEYHYKITRNMSGNTDLLKLNILDPAVDIKFQPDITEYYFSIPNNYTKINKMEIESEDPDAETFVSGNNDFNVGQNKVTISVTSPSGEVGIYILNVYREKNENVYLSNLEVKHNDLSYEILPSFNKINTGTYQVTVPNEVDSVNVIATPEVSTTQVSNDGLKNLSVGINRVQIITTSETGTTEIYYLEITREKNNNTNLVSITAKNGETIYPLDPTFTSDNLMYTVEVEEGTTEIELTATTEVTTTTYKLLDNNKLKVGENLKRIMTAAEDGSNKIYNVIVKRPANEDNYLTDITLSTGSLFPEFDKEGLTYSVTVPNEVSKITVTGIKSNPLAKVNGNGEYALAVGSNEILLSVISETGAIRIYQIIVTREANSNAYLSSITTSEGVIIPDKTIDSQTYEITVPSTTKSINVTGIPEVALTKVMGNGTYNTDAKETTIILTTFAEDNTSIQYTVIVKKEDSNNNYLKYLLVEEGNIDPTFTKENTSYTVTIPNEFEKITLHVEPEDQNANITILDNENFVVGENNVTIRVTSENNEVRDYIIKVIRQEDFTNSDYLANLSVTNFALNPDFQKEEQYYEITVPYETTNINVSATPEDINATVTGQGTYNLSTGKNTIVVQVLSTENKTRDYQIVVTRKESNEARLKTLTLGNDILSPNFNKDTFTYNVTTTAKKLDFTKIIPEDEKATYEIINNEFTTPGNYEVIIRVTAADQETIRDYTINVTKNASKNNNLSSLTIDGFTITPEFNSATTIYRLTVPNNINSVLVNATNEDDRATITGTGTRLLSIGENQLVVEVTSESGSKKSYTIIVTKLESTDNHLADLIVNNGTMSPEFNDHLSTYNVEIDYEETALDLTVILSDDKASYEIVDNENLSVGDNVVKIIVTAEDGNTNTIILNVKRNSISSALLDDLKVKNYPFEFNSHINHYDLLINYETDQLDLNIIPKDSLATYAVSGNENLVVGENTITILVTASDGVTQETYTLNVTKQKYATTFLSYLYTSEGDVTPDFNKTTLEYSIDVANTVKKIELFGEAADKSATVEGLGEHDLVVGENLLKIIVTAKNGVVRTYYVTVNRAPSTNNYLENLIVKTGANVYDLTPEFSSEETEYTINVPVGTPDITIDGTVPSPATVTGFGDYQLHVGENIFQVIVTGENGEDKIYTITINREASTNNHLISLVPSVGTLEPSFAYEELNYTINLDSSSSILSFDVLTEDEFATVTGEEAQVIPDGESTRTITITAEDGTPRVITIKVNKEREDNALLSTLSVKDYTFTEEFSPTQFKYHITVPNDKKVLQSSEVFATTADSEATITKTSNLALLTTQDNEYIVTVTAKDGFTKQNYKIIVTREKSSNDLLETLVVNKGALEPAFTSDNTTYTWKLPANTTIVTDSDVTATAKDLNATISKTTNLTITGTNDKFIVKVVSENGQKTKEYILNIEIDATSDTTLSSLVVELGYYTPTFDPATKTYDVYTYVDADEINITATPNDATSSVTSGNGLLTLTADETTHKIVVSASSGTSDFYTLNIHRTILRDSGLANLGLNGLTAEECSEGLCELSPEFNSETLQYKINVPLSYENFDVLAEPMNEQQTIKILRDGAEVTDNSLPIGVTTITVEVYDGLGVLTKTYELAIERSIKLLSITPSETDVYLLLNEEKEITYTLDPVDATYADVNYTSDDETIATFVNGKITALSLGTTTVKIVSDHYENIVATINVHVIGNQITSTVYDVKRFTAEETDKVSHVIGIEPNTKLKDFINNFDNPASTIHVFSNDGTEITDNEALIGTEMVVKLIINEVEHDLLKIAVRGDLTGDGKITGPDYVKLKNYMLKKIELPYIEYQAADLVIDDKITGPDYVKLKNYMLKKVDTLN